MTIDLTRDEIWFLKALRAAGERGRIVSALASHAGLARLVELQYVTKQPQSERKILYAITDRPTGSSECIAIDDCAPPGAVVTLWAVPSLR
jgi:hypothetical protein